MKKFILLFAIAVSAIAAQAQTASGTFFAGGSLGFNSSSNKIKVGSTSNDDWKRSEFFFNPAAGYFVADKTLIGITANLGREKTTTFSNNNNRSIYTTTPLNIGIFGRRYFMLNEQFGFTGTLNVLGIFGNEETENYDASTNTTIVTKFKIRGFSTSITAGPVWFATPHIGIEANMGLLGFANQTSTRENSNPELSETESGFSFGLNAMSLNLGLYYYIF